MRFRFGTSVCLSLLLLMSTETGRATTLSVNCAAKAGLHSIGAALNVLRNGEGHEPSTINVSGACKENVVIQSLDRLTLNAVHGASVSDASGGMLDVISIQDSRDVAINGFTVNAGGGVGNGVVCGDFSICRLSGNLIQGSGPNATGGFVVFGQSQATLNGDTLQNNGFAGLFVSSGSRVRGGPFTSRANGQGINVVRQSLVFVQATVENNFDQGVVVQFQSTVQLDSSSISNNGSVGAHVREGSTARFTGNTSMTNITNNGGPGVLIHDLSMVTFDAATVTGNGGGTDVVCSPQFPATRGVGGIGGTTNCVEP